jgi:hypothetical protein
MNRKPGQVDRRRFPYSHVEHHRYQRITLGTILGSAPFFRRIATMSV